MRNINQQARGGREFYRLSWLDGEATGQPKCHGSCNGRTPGDMKLKRNLSCLVGSVALAGLALVGLVALGPLNGVNALYDLLLRGALLLLFWLGYVTLMIYVLCFLGGRIFGCEPERDERRPTIED